MIGRMHLGSLYAGIYSGLDIAAALRARLADLVPQQGSYVELLAGVSRWIRRRLPLGYVASMHAALNALTLAGLMWGAL